MTSTSEQTEFQGRGVACRRGGRRVFEKLNFTLKPSGALVLRGPNGSGKSTLIRLMAGLLPAAAGEVKWTDAPDDTADRMDIHRTRICYVGHQDAVKPALTVSENLAFWAGLQNGGDVPAALEAMGLGGLADLPARFLSAGQRRRVNLARLTLTPLPLWLLDEPATALDQETRLRLNDLIARHRAGGGMVVVSTHEDLDLREAASMNLADYAPGPMDETEETAA